ncbi:MAG: hypothetical protein ACRCTD_14725 [Beijerinckiaceae bacterium]
MKNPAKTIIYSNSKMELFQTACAGIRTREERSRVVAMRILPEPEYANGLSRLCQGRVMIGIIRVW